MVCVSFSDFVFQGSFRITVNGLSAYHHPPKGLLNACASLRQQLHRRLCHGGHIQPEGGQRRFFLTIRGKIIKPHHGYILRHPQAPFPQKPDHQPGRAVAVAYQRGRQLFRQGNRKALFGALAASLLLVPALYLLAGKSILFGKYPAAPLPFLRLTTPEEFAALGPVVADGPDVEIRCRPRQDGTLIGARLKRRAESDLKFRFILGRGNERLTKEVTFANGLRPADSVETGTAFFVLLPPLEGGFPEQVQAEVLPL